MADTTACSCVKNVFISENTGLITKLVVLILLKKSRWLLQDIVRIGLHVKISKNLTTNPLNCLNLNCVLMMIGLSFARFICSCRSAVLFCFSYTHNNLAEVFCHCCHPSRHNGFSVIFYFSLLNLAEFSSHHWHRVKYGRYSPFIIWWFCFFELNVCRPSGFIPVDLSNSCGVLVCRRKPLPTCCDQHNPLLYICVSLLACWTCTMM